MRRRHGADLLFDLQPHGHWRNTHVLARQTREEKFAPVFAFAQGAKVFWHVESMRVIDTCRRVAPKHATLLHFWPQISTEIIGEGRLCCQCAKRKRSVGYVKLSPSNRPLGRTPNLWVTSRGRRGV